MALIDLIEVSKQFDTKKILCNVDFSIQQNQRVAIAGKNGSGKSTLMKIIMNQIEPDNGRVIKNQKLTVKMLDQKPKFQDNIIVRDAIEAQLEHIKSAKEKFDLITKKLVNDYNNKELIQEHSKLSSILDFYDGWDLENKIERVLNEFALKEYEYKPVELLSGGEQRRVALAGLLLNKPDILLLDEPTNHLDVYMVEFLEEMLLKNRFTILFVSHDRYFIDNIATDVIEIDDCKIRAFKGGYSSFILQKEELLRNMQKEHETMLKFLKSEEEWLNRGVKARLKRNEGRKKRVMELKEKAKSNPSLIRKIKVELEREQKNYSQDSNRSRKKMLFEIENISKNLGNKTLIKNFSYRILQRDVIAIVGHNGSGKSTLLKILLDRMKIDSGKIKRGDFKIGYFDQHREMLDDDKNIIETFCPNGGDRVDVWGKNMHVFGYLKNFLFPKEYLDKKIGVLSGGEKNRVALALLFTKAVDCLIFDEPTNDLDIPTINIVEEYLQKFQGALIIVSHDRYFLDKIAKKLLIFKGNGLIEESFQKYSEYLDIEKELKNLNNFSENIENNNKINIDKNININNNKIKKKLTFNEQKEYDSLPDKIEKYELEIEELNKCLSNEDCYKDIGILELSKKIGLITDEYENLVERYLELEELIESFN